MFKTLFNFFKSLFKAARPGLEDFLRAQEHYVAELVDFALAKADSAFVTLKPAIFAQVQAKTHGLIPGTWISIAIDLAYERVRAEAAKRLQAITPFGGK